MLLRKQHERVQKLRLAEFSFCLCLISLAAGQGRSEHGDALMAGRSRRGNGNDGYRDAGPQAMLGLR